MGTMVVVPTLFSSEEGVHELLERLEVHFLANQDEHIYFALLGDFVDADTEELAEDAVLLDTALSGSMAEQRYRRPTSTVSSLSPHRNGFAEGKWMGWERKR